MTLTLALGLVFATQAPVAATAPELQPDQTTDAAYGELAAGRTAEAITLIEEARAKDSANPALLINLGTAYAQQGRFDEARLAYRAAIAANDSVFLETSSGKWVEARTLARIALNRLDGSGTLAMR
jgi:uncharacterized protein HemY